MNIDRELEKLLSRHLDRRTLLKATGAIVFSSSIFGMIGCGGSSSSTSGFSGRLVSITGKVELPAGFSTAVGALTLGNAVAQAPVAASAFTIQTASAGPSITYLQDALGHVLMMGYLDPTNGTATINPVSTAAVLIFIGLDGSSLPEATRSQVFSLIRGNSATIAAASVISARLLADPLALDNNDAQIVTAVKTAVTQVIGGTKAISQRAAKAVAQPKIDITQIQPTGQQSGSELLLDSATDGFKNVNHFRRYGRVFVYKTGVVSPTDVITTYPTVQPFGTPVDIKSTQNLGLFTAIGDILTRTSPFSPVTSPLIPLALDANTKKTLYDVVVVGSSADPDEPSFFSLPQYSSQVATWRAAVSSLTLKSWFADVYFGLLLDAIGVRQIVLDDIAIEGAIASLTAIEDAAWQVVIAQAKSGKFGKAAVLAMERIVEDDLVANACFAALIKIVGNAEAAAAIAVKQASFKTYVRVFLRACANVIIAAFGALGLGDIGAVVHDLASSRQGDVWTATVTKPTLTLNPSSKTIKPGERVTFTVSQPFGVTSPVEYDWTQNSTFGTLSSSDGIVGNSIVTSSRVVDLVTTPSDQSAVTLQVKAFAMVNGVKTEIGSAVAAITFTTGGTGQTLGSVAVTTTAIAVLRVSYNTLTVPIGYVYGYIVFKPTNASRFDMIRDGNYNLNGNSGALTQAQILTPPPVFDPGSNPYTVVSNTSYSGTFTQSSPDTTLVNSVTSAQPVAGNFYNLGGGIVAAMAYVGVFDTTAGTTQTAAIAVAEATALMKRITVVATP